MQASAVGGGSSSSAKVDISLVNLRARLLDLHARVTELHDLLLMLRDGMGEGRHARWGDFLTKYDTIAKLYAQTTNELDRAAVEAGVESFLCIPKRTTTDVSVLPELLRTKLEREAEREVKEMQKGYIGKPGGAKRKDVYNDLVSQCLDEFAELRDSLVTDRPKHERSKGISRGGEAVLKAIVRGDGLK